MASVGNAWVKRITLAPLAAWSAEHCAERRSHVQHARSGALVAWLSTLALHAAVLLASDVETLH